jgi:hypothetical protein
LKTEIETEKVLCEVKFHVYSEELCNFTLNEVILKSNMMAVLPFNTANKIINMFKTTGME